MRQVVFMLMLAFGLTGICGCNNKPSFRQTYKNSYVTIRTVPDGATVCQVNLPTYSQTLLGETPLIEQPVLVATEIYKAKNLPFELMQELTRSVGNIKVTIKKEGYKTFNGYLKAAPGKNNEHTITLNPVE